MRANVKETKCYLCPRTLVTHVPNLYTPPSAHAMMNSQEKQRANFYAVLSGNGRVRHGRSQLSFAKYPQPHPKWRRRHPR